MRKGFFGRAPIQSNRGQITAKGPSDVGPMAVEQFVHGVNFVTKHMAINFSLPKIITRTSTPDKKEFDKILALAISAFKQDRFKSLQFFMRFRAMINLVPFLLDKRCIEVKDDAPDHAVYHPSVFAAAAEQPLLPDGSFDSDAFLARVIEHAQTHDDDQLKAWLGNIQATFNDQPALEAGAA